MDESTLYETLRKLPDAELVERARTCSIAFTVLYERYFKKIYNFTFYRLGNNHQLAEDVTAKTFEVAVRKLRDGSLRNDNVKAWLYTVARNETNQLHRRKPEYGLENFLLSVPSHVENEIANVQIRESLRSALDQLSPSDKELLELRFLEELSRTEVAAILGTTSRNVSVRVTRACGRLRKHMDKQGVKPEVVRFALEHRTSSSLWHRSIPKILMPPLVSLLMIFMVLVGMAQ